jgi:hypothetical protein
MSVGCRWRVFVFVFVGGFCPCGGARLGAERDGHHARLPAQPGAALRHALQDQRRRTRHRRPVAGQLVCPCLSARPPRRQRPPDSPGGTLRSWRYELVGVAQVAAAPPGGGRASALRSVRVVLPDAPEKVVACREGETRRVQQRQQEMQWTRRKDGDAWLKGQDGSKVRTLRGRWRKRYIRLTDTIRRPCDARTGGAGGGWRACVSAAAASVALPSRRRSVPRCRAWCARSAVSSAARARAASSSGSASLPHAPRGSPATPLAERRGSRAGVPRRSSERAYRAPGLVLRAEAEGARERGTGVEKCASREERLPALKQPRAPGQRRRRTGGARRCGGRGRRGKRDPCAQARATLHS